MTTFSHPSVFLPCGAWLIDLSKFKWPFHIPVIVRGIIINGSDLLCLLFFCCCFFVLFSFFFILRFGIKIQHSLRKLLKIHGLIFKRFVILNRKHLRMNWSHCVRDPHCELSSVKWKKKSQEKTSAVWLTPLTHEWAFSCRRLYLLLSPCLHINLFNEPCYGVGWTYSRCGYLIKTVPLGSNGCYLRLGRSRMGGK